MNRSRYSHRRRPANAPTVAGDEAACKAVIEIIAGRGAEHHGRPKIRRAERQADLNYLVDLEDVKALYLILPHL